MQSHHPIRDRIEAGEKWGEALILKAQATLPATQSIITTAKKVGSPVLKGVRRIGDPVVDLIDSGITSVAKNGTAIINNTTEFAQTTVKQGVGVAFNATDRVLTPPPDEAPQPKTICGLVTHINNGLRYVSRTKIKPWLGFDPYDRVMDIMYKTFVVSIFMLQLVIIPFQWFRDKIAPAILCLLNHKCEQRQQSNDMDMVRGDRSSGSGSGNANGSSSGGDEQDQHRDRDLDTTADDASSSSSSSSSLSTVGRSVTTSGGSAHCSTGSNVNSSSSNRGRGGKRSSSRGSGTASQSLSAKTNSSNTHDAEI